MGGVVNPCCVVAMVPNVQVLAEAKYAEISAETVG